MSRDSRTTTTEQAAGRHLHDRVDDVAVLCCTEAGALERQSLLLCETIRLRAGRYASVPIYSFQPRPGPALAPRTRRRFAELGVIHIEAPFNCCLPNFGMANKPHVAAWAEAFLPHGTLVILDSDSLVLAEPEEFALTPDERVAVTPEPFKVAGTSDDDENAAMWDAYESHLGIDRPRRYVTTLIDRERIRGYYNSGLVVVRRELGLMRLWHDVMESIATSGHVPPDSRAVFTEQIALTLALAKLGMEPRVLPTSYNYQIAWHDQLPDDVRARSLDDVVVAHYHRRLDEPTTRNPLTLIEGLTLTERDSEIGDLIHSTGVTPHPLRSPVRSARRVVRRRVVPLAKRIGLHRGRYVDLVKHES